MDFLPNKVETFLTYFESIKDIVANQEGCISLKFCQDVNNPNVYYTVSQWKGEFYLEQYRKSETFSTIWATTKALFATKAIAYSLTEII
jgi:quinol monooxygenase YgiN